jgi:protein ImuB
MSRIVSVWLPRWPVLRFLKAQARTPCGAPVDPALPLVLAADAAGGPCIAALNRAAEAEGLAAGDALADARARIGFLQVRAADPAADAAALRKLALWATRYTPAAAPFDAESGGDGFFLDITGAAHLMGGEEMLIADLSHRLARLGLPARLAVAGTAGAAWALSRFHRDLLAVLPPGAEAEALGALPVEALRLSPATRLTLRRLGFKRVGTLIDAPRAPFAARFETELLKRLDQALGRRGEPLAWVVPPPLYHRSRSLLEPIATQEAIVAAAASLMQDLAGDLLSDGAGARALRLSLYRVDGAVQAVDLGLTLPTRSAAHVAYLLGLKLERMGTAVEVGFGFEALALAVTIAERMEPKQGELVCHAGEGAERTAALVDALKQRLGAEAVWRLAPAARHLPERSETPCPAAGEAPPWPAPDATRLRPLLLLSRPEPADDVIALVPEGPPQRFRWRGKVHAVARAQGPERIAGEWWGERTPQPTRDYYLVEDDAGRRFWLYRAGLYGRETAAPRWFVHGMFA